MAPDCAYWTLIRTIHGWLTELAGKGDPAPLTALLPAGERAEIIDARRGVIRAAVLAKGDLLTRKAERLIRAASVIFHNALIGPGILDLVPRSVRLVPVGTRAGRHSSTQDDIDALLVAAASAGERVVRLKGGDPSIFGRSMEEIDALARVGIRAPICPGITAASAAAASTGISRSLRGAARQVRFVTAQTRAGAVDTLDWASLADPDTTLAFYMGRAAAPDNRRNWIAHGLAADTPVLIAINVSLADEHLLHTRLDLLPVAIDGAAGSGPSLILIGEAALARMPVYCAAILLAVSDGWLSAS